MIFIGLAVIVAIWMAIVFSTDTWDSLIGTILSFVITIPLFSVIGFFTGTLLAFAVGLIGLFLPTESIIVEQAPIYSIVDQTATSGSFVLGCGSTESDLSIYYVQEVDGGKSIKKSDSNETIITESDTENPNVKIIGERYKWEWLSWIVADVNSINDKTILTVPVNTVTTEYNVDLK